MLNHHFTQQPPDRSAGDNLPLTAANLCNRARRASLLGDGGVKPTRNRVMNLHRDSQSAVS